MLSLTSCKEAPKKEKKVVVEKVVEKEEATENAKEIEAKLAEQQAHEAQMKKAKEEASAKEVEAEKQLKTAQAKKAVANKTVTKKATQAKTKATAKPKLTKSAANKLKEVKQVATPIAKTEIISGPAIETISPKDFYAKVKNGGVQLLDLRTQREFTANRIKGAKMFDIYKRTFIEDVINGGIDKNKPIYIYCLTASRSRSGAAKLSKAGYKKVYELKGGIKLWYQQGLPIEK